MLSGTKPALHHPTIYLFLIDVKATIHCVPQAVLCALLNKPAPED